MRINLKDEVAGVSMRVIRAALRKFRLGGRILPTEVLTRHLGVALLTPEAQVAALTALHAQGWLEAYQDGDGVLWKITDSGVRLAYATATPPIKRAAALQEVAALVERAGAINQNPAWLFVVETLVLFGSLTDAAALTVNDIDIAFELKPREPNPEAHLEKLRARIDALEAGSFSSTPDTEVLRALKARRRSLSFHDLSELEKNSEAWERPVQVVLLREGQPVKSDLFPNLPTP